MTEKSRQNGTTVATEYEVRVQKVKGLRAQGIEPWPENVTLNQSCHDIITGYERDYDQSYTIAGRVMAIRAHGKSIFAHIQDRTGKVQLYLKVDQVGEKAFNLFLHFVDLGDIVLCSGTSFKTKTGEISLAVQTFQIVSKCLHPLPDKFHGLVDQEAKYRQRYLDLMVNPETRERFVRRSLIVRTLRTFLDEHDFFEVETPMLHPIAGGATARPFVTHHHALDMNFFLRIAPELYLKRLVVGGLERVYEINRNFRNEGVSTRHNPEFTMLEFYMAYQDYQFIMDFVEQMLRTTAKNVLGTSRITYGPHEIDLDKRFDRISPTEAITRYTDLTGEELAEDRIDRTCAAHGIDYQGFSYNKKIFALFESRAEQHLIQPTFIVDYPIEISPLAKRDAQNPTKAARFELFIAGMEIGNGFNELNDPFDQADRFKEQLVARQAGDEEAMSYDADYVTALEYGLPPTVGVGVGIDRFTMLLTNTTTIKEVILFPALKLSHE